VILSRLGMGGMGVVYGAHDPDLDRKVALKLLHGGAAAGSHASDGHRRLLREAQAMAKVSHRNVITVHDVGEWQGRVYVAMELVVGVTLREWLREPRPWSEILGVFRGAGEGLAAAHQQGLVHRDFKPDNAMLGTPAYMSPEQHAGVEVDAASDQFSYCVALYEALYGERPFAGGSRAALAVNVLEGRLREPPRGRRVPRWVHRALVRGLAARASDRHPSMRALLDALARGQLVARRRVVAAGFAVLAVAVGSGAVLQRLDHQARAQACLAAGDLMDETWGDAARARIRAGIEGTGVDFAAATISRVTPLLDARATEWKAARGELCLASELRGDLAPELAARAEWCLDERRLELGAFVEQLASADAGAVRKAIYAASMLTSGQTCLDEGLLARLPPPPPAARRADALRVREALAGAEAGLTTGRFDAGLAAAEAASTLAVTAGWPALEADTARVRGALLAAKGEHAAAKQALGTAYVRAATANAWSSAASAAVQLSHLTGVDLAKREEGRVWAINAEVALTLTGAPPPILEARRLNNLALIDHGDDRFDEARRGYDAAIAVLTAELGETHPELATPLLNLAGLERAVGNLDEALRLHQRVLALRIEHFGDDHPDVAASYLNLGNVYHRRGDLGEAKANMERALTIFSGALGEDHPHVSLCLTNLAGVHDGEGDYARAVELGTKALAARERTLAPDHPDIGTSLNNLGLFQLQLGQLEDARASLERALAIREAAFGLEHTEVAATLNNLGLSYARGMGATHPEVASSLSTLGSILLDRGQASAAREAFDVLSRSVAIYDAIEGTQENEPMTRFRLAIATRETGGDETEARALAQRALDDLRALGDDPAEDAVAIEAWLEAGGGARGR
jgi:tetratricopeptide (TPR) repeat protein